MGLNWTKVGLKCTDRQAIGQPHFAGLNWTKVGLKSAAGSGLTSIRHG